MSEYLSDKEQWDEIRGWIREYGPSVIAGVAIAAAIGAGWYWWKARLDARGLRASAIYTQMVDALEHGNRADAFTHLGELERSYPGSPYADQAKLLAARVEVEANELDKAAQELTHVAQNSKDHGLALVARERLARVQIAQGKPDEALATLNAVSPGAFAARYEAVRGDAYYAKGDSAAALKAYRSAAGAADPGDSALLNLKIADLAAAAHPAAATTAATPAPASSTK
ncbi:MAG TPA: tetratricopeptide repeat protein [Steroidobacteraceae bacterium]|nr:tetratricopeptide repeat protein [Steroidobacteraceae bacterium]